MRIRLILPLLFCVLSSCTGLVNTDRPYTPLLSHPKEVNLTGNVNALGFDVQAAYSLRNHYGIFFSFNEAVQDTSTYRLGDFFWGYQLRGGAMYYDSLNVNEHAEAGVSIAFGHASGLLNQNWSAGFFTNFSSNYQRPSYEVVRHVSTDMVSLEAHTEIGIEGRVGAIGGGLRANAIQLYNWDQIDESTPPQETKGARFGMFIEPYIFFKIGYDPVKLIIEYWGTVGIPGFRETYTPINASFGIQLKF